MSQDTFGGEKEGEKMALDTQFKLWKSKRAGTAAAAAVPASGTFSGTMGHCIHTHTHTHIKHRCSDCNYIFRHGSFVSLLLLSSNKRGCFHFFICFTRAHFCMAHLPLQKGSNDLFVCVCAFNRSEAIFVSGTFCTVL